MPQSVVGTFTLDGKRLAGVEVVLTDGAGTALASQATDAAGRFRLDPPGSFAGGWVVARLHEPIVGAATHAVAAGDTVADLAVASSSAVTLSLTVKPPARVPLDWALVKLSPRAVPDVPDPVVAAAKLVGTGPSVRGSYHTVRVTGPHLDLRVLPGTWESPSSTSWSAHRPRSGRRRRTGSTMRSCWRTAPACLPPSASTVSRSPATSKRRSSAACDQGVPRGQRP